MRKETHKTPEAYSYDTLSRLTQHEIIVNTKPEGFLVIITIEKEL